MNEGGMPEKSADMMWIRVKGNVREGGESYQNELFSLVCKCNITGNVTELTFETGFGLVTNTVSVLNHFSQGLS